MVLFLQSCEQVHILLLVSFDVHCGFVHCLDFVDACGVGAKLLLRSLDELLHILGIFLDRVLQSLNQGL